MGGGSRCQPDGLAVWTHLDGSTVRVIIERPASFIHGDRYFVVRPLGQERVWQLAPGKALSPVEGGAR